MNLDKIRWCWILVAFLTLVMTSTPVQANVNYDSDVNTIILKSGINTLESIYSEINDPSVLSYDGVANSYVLSANIRGEDGINSHLLLEDTTLIINNTAVNSYSIITWADLVVNNMKIKPMNYLYPWYIQAYAKDTEYSVFINNSDISGGRVIIKPNTYQSPRIPTVITNNIFHDFSLNDIYSDHMLSLELHSGSGAIVYNNTFNNITIEGSSNPGPSPLYISSATNFKADKITLSDISLNGRGAISFYGGSENAIISNFTIKDSNQDGITGKEFGNVIYQNGTITNVLDDGIFFYHSIQYGEVINKVWNVAISGARNGISTNSYSWITADIYNVTIDDVGTAFSTGSDSKNIFYITNTLVTNCNSLYDVQSGEIREYVLTDLCVVDNENKPIEGATITITPNEPNVEGYAINRNLRSLIQTTTLANGHTPLPAEDTSSTLAVLRYRETPSSEAQYTYTITAEKNGISNSVTINPDSSWYRTNPNTYQNTTTIVLSSTTSENHAPILATIGDKSINEGSLLEFTLSASDDDSDVLTYSATNLPTGATFNPTTRTFSWTPVDGKAGSYQVHFEVSDGSLTDAEDITIKVIEVVEQQAPTVLDNRLRESSPDTVIEDSTWIDVGRIDGAGNYRGTIWFNLSQFNSTDHIESAKLSLFWYYENRNQSTDVNIYRPDNWDSDYVTWNTRTNGVTWNNAGGDWYDRNNLGQGTEAYATVTFPVDAKPDYAYHDFDVTELVQSYVNGIYDNTGFFIKANEVNNTYIAFYSSDWSNVSQQPKLTINHTPQGDEPAPDLPPTANPGSDHTITVGDSITFEGSGSTDDNGIVSYVWDFDASNGLQQDATGAVVIHTYDTAGTYTVTLTVTDTDGNTDTDTAVVTVLDASSSSSVSISPSSSLVAPGETFTVDVTVSPGEPIIGAQFNLNFDSSLLTVNSVTEGNLFSQDGASTHFSSGAVDNIAGTVTNVYGSILGETSISSSGVLATITLTAGSTGGVSVLDLSNVVISDATSNATIFTVTNATVRINTPPLITTFEPIEGAVFGETDVITIGVTAFDADEQSLSYTIKIDDITCSTGSGYSWTTDYTSAGTHTIEVTVSDGISETTAQRTITINNVHPRWDVNEDGTVDVLDLTTIGQQYGTSIEEPYPRWDVNQDGVVNILDMTITSSHFGETDVE